MRILGTIRHLAAGAAIAGMLSVLGCKSVPSLAPSVQQRGVTVERAVPYCSSAGTTLVQDLVRPVRGRNGAVIVYLPGGSWQQWIPRIAHDALDAANDDNGRPDLTYSPIVRALAAQGYAVAITYTRGGPAHRFPSHVVDARCAIRSLRARAKSLGVDPDRIGILGGSSGGHIAALAALADESAGWDSNEYTGYSSKVRALVVASAPYTMSGPFPQKVRPLFESVFGSSEEGSAVFKQASPLTHASSDDPPVMVLHGEQDRTVPRSEADALHQRLLEARVKATLLVVKEGGHSLLWPSEEEVTAPTSAEIRKRIIDFFDANLDH